MVQDRRGAGTVRKACSLLQLVAQSPAPLRLTEISRRAQLNHATTHRLLASLVDYGLLTFEEAERRYRLGLRVLELAGVLLDSMEIVDVARPDLAKLAEEANETVHLATVERSEVVFLDRIDGTQPVSLRTRVGARAPIHVTAVGKAYLAFAEPSALDELRATLPLSRLTDRTITEWPVFLDHLATVRRQGYAIDNEEHRRTIRCVAAPILDYRRRVVAAVSVAGPSSRLTLRRTKQLARLVQDTAARISREIGGRPPSEVARTRPTTEREVTWP